ncbi:MAG: hypothetical protein R3C53_04320 [Pirellulaceae bacterium]
MTSETLEQAFETLPQSGGRRSGALVRKLGELVDGELPLQAFLELLLPQMCELFAASAAVAWMKTQGANGAVFGVRYRMDQMLDSVTEHKRHERLVQLAWQQRQPMLAEPSAAKTGEVGNPTGRPILFGPCLHFGEPIALLEIVLAEHDEGMTQEQRQRFLRCVQLLAERVYGGLRSRIAMPAANVGVALQNLEQLTNDVLSMQQQILRAIETRLQTFHGWAFASLAENQEFARAVHTLLDSHGLRVECSECGYPAILRCLSAGNAKRGAFVFDHYLDSGRTFHGGLTTVPLIRVVPKPARRAAINNPA